MSQEAELQESRQGDPTDIALHKLTKDKSLSKEKLNRLEVEAREKGGKGWGKAPQDVIDALVERNVAQRKRTPSNFGRQPA